MYECIIVWMYEWMWFAWLYLLYMIDRLDETRHDWYGWVAEQHCSTTPGRLPLEIISLGQSNNWCFLRRESVIESLEEVAIRKLTQKVLLFTCSSRRALSLFFPNFYFFGSWFFFEDFPQCLAMFVQYGLTTFEENVWRTFPLLSCLRMRLFVYAFKRHDKVLRILLQNIIIK